MLLFYSLQVLITIWKELNSSDKYTPFVTPAGSGLGLNTFYKHFNSHNADNHRQIENNRAQQSVDNQASSYRWDQRTIKYSQNHVVTPAMEMTFNPLSMRSVTSDGSSGTFDVRNRVYADSHSIQQMFNNKPMADSPIVNSELQELQYRVSYPLPTTQKKINNTPYVNVDHAHTVCLSLSLLIV